MGTTMLSERQQLKLLIQQWNENRLDLFNLSMPDENDEFHGVMRFYYQEPGAKVVTKCVRVSSGAKTPIVLEALVEKFRPDLNLSNVDWNSFSIWEVHESGEERMISMDEHPLIVQLTWHKDDREGRFLFKMAKNLGANTSLANTSTADESLNRNPKRFSKKEKKELRKKHQRQIDEELKRNEEQAEMSKKLYDEVPPTTFTRTISNPEAVMKKRRELRLENRLKEMGHGGSLKIFGAELNPQKPYVTLLVSLADKAYKIVRDTLDKYGREHESADDFVLVEITIPRTGGFSRSLTDLREVDSGAVERFFQDDEKPLMSLLDDSADIIFAVRKRPPHLRQTPHTSFGVNNTVTHYAVPETASLSDSTGTGSMYQQIQSDYLAEPVLIPLDPNGRELFEHVLQLKNGATEVGSDPRSSQCVIVRGPNILPKHCVISYVDGIVAVTPFDGLLEVNGVRIETTQMLRDGFVVRIGGQHSFRLRSNASRLQAPNYANSPIMPKSSSTMEMQSRMPPATHFSESSILNLPALIELYDQNVEDDFLKNLLLDSTPDRFSFKLIPAFVIYMVTRYRISAHLYRPGLSVDERRRHLQVFLDKVSDRIFHVVHVNSSNKAVLAFWLANMSELTNLLKFDQEVASLAGAQVVGKLQGTVEQTYQLLVETARVGLQSSMTSFLKVKLDNHLAARDILAQLDDLVRIIRRTRLNAALTIQLFSQLFYFVNMYAFNWLVTTKEGSMYLSKMYGVSLRDRLTLINRWAEQQGLELAAECHMDRLQQTVNLLITPKTIDQIASLGATCYKLNSLQVRYLLENYVNEVGEPRASKELIDHVATLSQSQADMMAQQDGQRVQLDENSQLQLSFVFPQDGYVVENFHGIPADMSDFIASLQAKGICRLMPQIGATGSWTVHLSNQHVIRSSQDMAHSSTGSGSNNSGIHPSSQASTYRPANSPNIVGIMLRRVPGDSIGLSIVAAQGIGDSNYGIYVKKVVPHSAAHRDGKLEMGDQLLSVNGHSLIGITQEEAAVRISQAGSDVHFEVSKRAAYSNGIIDSLDKPNTPLAPPPRQNGHANGYPSQQQQFQQPPYQAQQMTQPDSQMYKHARSASASELFANQADNISLASAAPSVGPPTHFGNSKLPAHYKPANRPAVVQPGRPTQPSPGPLRKAVSPTPLYNPQQHLQQQHQRSASTVPFGAVAQQRPQPQWLDNYSNLPSINGQGSRQHSSNTSSPLPPAPHPPRPQSGAYQQSHFPPAVVKPVPLPKPVSGRSSAPLFDHPTRGYPEPQSTRQLTLEDLDAELEAIESRGNINTETDIARYHFLLGRIGEIRDGGAPLAQSRSTSDFPSIDRLQNERHTRSTSNGIAEQPRTVKPAVQLPFMSEMTSRLESKKPNGTVFSSKAGNQSTEKAIDDVAEQFERLNSVVLTPQHEYPPSTSAGYSHHAVVPMPRPAMRENGSSPEDKSKKRVQFRETVEENDIKENGHAAQASSSSLHDLHNNNNNGELESAEPRVQIVGNNEVYINDPRQRRLNEIQQKLIKPSVDGAHLAFRDKMKMFATQLGESTPKDKQKVSSAQREIENTSDAI